MRLREIYAASLTHLAVNEARFLIEKLYGVKGAALMLEGESKVDAALFLAVLERLKNNEPLARIFNSQEFFSLEFKLNDATLIPRADTEILVETVLKLASPSARLIDLGTGSGCIIISLLRNLPLATGVASDLSLKALEAAKENALVHGVNERINFIQSDWFEKIEGRFDVIISNPPYIGKSEILEESVTRFDPEMALFAENEGLAAYEMILSQAKDYLNPKGKVVVEIGYQQGESVAQIGFKQGFMRADLSYDLAKNPRVLTFS